ncbi:cytochrome C oxidase subunit IV family protein [Schlesneria paludicola]|uniref:cytochrome C oxidase subunit IV family protein n=1 Tax=Schlesneria paludicola TaxID=360056 RepID=UPI00029B05DD|nr:cytochrome C oxidase subunit IV family protein [Schlesneria paludicola]
MMSAANPVKTYVAVYAALLVLLAISVCAAEFDLGRGNFVVSLAIASAKALLIVLFFMHVRGGAVLVKLVLIASLFWLAIMFTLSATDYGTRHWGHERQHQNEQARPDAINPKPMDDSKPL